LAAYFIGKSEKNNPHNAIFETGQEEYQLIAFSGVLELVIGKILTKRVSSLENFA